MFFWGGDFANFEYRKNVGTVGMKWMLEIVLKVIWIRGIFQMWIENPSHDYKKNKPLSVAFQCGAFIPPRNEQWSCATHFIRVNMCWWKIHQRLRQNSGEDNAWWLSSYQCKVIETNERLINFFWGGFRAGQPQQLFSYPNLNHLPSWGKIFF